MRSLVHEEAHWIPIDGHFYGEIVRRAGLHRVPGHRIVMGVDERLVQVQNECLSLHQAQAMARDGRQREEFIFNRLILDKSSHLAIEHETDACPDF